MRPVGLDRAHQELILSRVNDVPARLVVHVKRRHLVGHEIGQQRVILDEGIAQRVQVLINRRDKIDVVRRVVVRRGDVDKPQGVAQRGELARREAPQIQRESRHVGQGEIAFFRARKIVHAQTAGVLHMQPIQRDAKIIGVIGRTAAPRFDVKAQAVFIGVVAHRMHAIAVKDEQAFDIGGGDALAHVEVEPCHRLQVENGGRHECVIRRLFFQRDAE